MFSSHTLPFAAAMLAGSAHALKVGVISDMHINMRYQPDGTGDDNCATGGGKADNYSPLAKYECDPSQQMAEYMVQRFVEAFGDVDVILAPGDAIAHGLAPDHDEESPDW